MSGELELSYTSGQTLPGQAFLKEGERRVVTVLFSDMKGFTALSERADPEEMDVFMTAVFAKFESVIRHHGGYVEKYIGDALVAVFGVPEVHEDDPRRAVQAALEMIGILKRIKLPAGIAQGDLQFRTGVHTGLVTTGRRGQYDVVTGHTLAIAARLQTSAPPNGVLASESTKEKCERDFIFSEAEEYQVKGKEDRIVAYRALSRRKAQLSFDGPFVGRDREIEALTAAYVRQMRGGNGAAYVSGDSGIGKTRLCAELYGKLRAFPNFQSTFLAVNAAQYGGFDYSTVLHAILDWLETGADLSEEEFASRVRERLAVDDGIAKKAAGLLGRGESGEADPGLLDAVASVFDAILSLDGDVYPDVVFIDNARFMDDKSRDFLRFYLSRTQSKPFVLLSDRVPSEEVATLFGQVERVQLPPLGDAESAALVRELVPGGFDELTVATIVKKAQGYPLFIEEYVKLLRKKSSGEDVPDTIQNAILASIDRIPGEARALLQKLSVLRYPVNPDDAAFMSARTEGPHDVAPLLAELSSERVMVAMPDGRFAFKHPIIKDSVYSTLLMHNRKVLHALAAQLELRSKRPEAEEVFYHLASSGDWQKATSYLLQERPRLGLDAAPLVQELIDAAPQENHSVLVELLFMKYAVHFNNLDLDGVDDIVHRMFAIAMRERNSALMARAYHLQMTWLIARGSYEDAAFYGMKAIDLYMRSGNTRGLSNSLFFYANCCVHLGENERAIAAIERMPRSDATHRRLYCAARAVYHLLTGDYHGNFEWNRQLAEMALEAGDETEAFHCRLYAAINIPETYEFQRALEYENYVPNPGVLTGEEILLFYVGMAMGLHMCGKTDRAREKLVAAEYYWRQVREDHKRADNCAKIAFAYFVLDDMGTCRDRAEAGLLEAIKGGNFAAMYELNVLLAETALMSNDKNEFSFFVREASYLRERKFHRSRKTDIRYNFFAYLLCSEGEEGDVNGHELQCSIEGGAFLNEAKRLLAEELAAIGEDLGKENLFRFHLFRMVRDAGGE
jgi:class 3 adenylate cyclase